MPIVISFDLEKAAPNDHNHIQSMLERYGWENLGGSSYRYPRLGSDQPTEDWFNHVIPSLMMLRGYVLKDSAGKLVKFTIDVQTSTGFRQNSKYGTPPRLANQIKFYSPNNKSFGIKKLKKWLDSIQFPY